MNGINNCYELERVMVVVLGVEKSFAGTKGGFPMGTVEVKG